MTEHEAPAADPADGREPDGARGPTPDQRCPSCGALRPPVVAWCTQCYARFDTAEAAAGDGDGTGPEVQVVGQGAVTDLPVGPELGPAHPAHDGTRPPADSQQVEARAQELLARLSAEGGGPGVRSWAGRVRGRGPKVALVLVGTVVLTALLFGTMAVLGTLL